MVAQSPVGQSPTSQQQAQGLGLEFSPACCCISAPGCILFQDRPNPDRFQVQVQNVANGTCVNCSDYNINIQTDSNDPLLNVCNWTDLIDPSPGNCYGASFAAPERMLLNVVIGAGFLGAPPAAGFVPVSVFVSIDINIAGWLTVIQAYYRVDLPEPLTSTDIMALNMPLTLMNIDNSLGECDWLGSNLLLTAINLP